MAELLDPFEREIRRTRSRVPLSPNLQRAFDDDMGRALAEFEARTSRPRASASLTEADIAQNKLSDEWRKNPSAFPKDFVPSWTIGREGPQLTAQGRMDAGIPDPENPEAVRQELIDPLMGAYGMDELSSPTRARPIQPRTFEMGNELVQIDPLSGQAKSVYSRPQVTPELTPRQKLEYSDLLKQRQTLMGKQFQTAADKERLGILDTQIASFFTPKQEATASPTSAKAEPGIFMGDPLQQPAPTAPSEAPTITSKQQFDSLPKGATYIGRNGKRYRKP